MVGETPAILATSANVTRRELRGETPWSRCVRAIDTLNGGVDYRIAIRFSTERGARSRPEVPVNEETKMLGRVRLRARYRAAVLAQVGTLAAGVRGPWRVPRKTPAVGQGLSRRRRPADTAPVTLSGYFETGFPLAKALADEFSKQYPNVNFKIREDQFTVITRTRPGCSRTTPDIMRLPQVVRPRQGRPAQEPRPVLQRLRVGQVPRLAARAAAPRPAAPARQGLAVRDGAQLQHHRRLLQQEARREIGMTGRPRPSPSSTTCSPRPRRRASRRSCSSTEERPRANFPLQALKNEYGRPGPVNDWIFQKPGRRSTPRRSEGRPAPRAVDQGRLLRQGRQRRRLRA